MKKVLSISLALVIFLCGCNAKDVKNGGNKKYKSPAPDNFSAVISVKQNGFEFSGTLERNNADALTFICSFPEELYGMKKSVASWGTQIDYLGVYCKKESNILPDSDILNLLSRVFAALSSPESYSAYVLGNSVICDGENDGIKFRLERDKKTMNIISVQIEEYSLTVSFSDYK